jgi:hypothetical protein
MLLMQLVPVVPAVWQARSHIPQCMASVAVLTHESSHSVSPPLQPHMLLMHGRPLPHGELQPPQCAALFDVLISQPFGPCASQFAWVESQVGVQVPEMH